MTSLRTLITAIQIVAMDYADHSFRIVPITTAASAAYRTPYRAAQKVGKCRVHLGISGHSLQSV